MTDSGAQQWEWLDADDPRLASSRAEQVARDLIVAARLSEVGSSGRAEVLSMLDHHGAALSERTTAPGHLTGSTLVVDHQGSSMVVLLHRKLRRWLQPGGHADGDTNLAAVALREATEETGLAGLRLLLPAVDLDVHAVDHGDQLGEHLHLDLRFVAVAPRGAELQGNHESLDLRWVSFEELEELADEEGLVRLARAGLEAVRAAGVARVS
uniref:Adenosylhomocysteinase n=1 Tax=uncultured bacterium A1Q1_fos_862 TaxID=1256590 RepID=L7VTP6_9BACT|nr:adenosylhomocysteinase [uncultured bacterium A1Q1_fos_862]